VRRREQEMLRSLGKKVVRMGRATVFVVGLSVILVMVFGVATTALAGNGPGDFFHLGQKNTVNRLSQLVGTTAGAMLRVDNDGSGTALDLRVGQGTDPSAKTVAPMKVDSQAKVTNLNADQLDGIDSSGFVQGNGGAMHGTVALSPGFGGVVLLHDTQSPHIDVFYSCPGTLSNNGGVWVTNHGGETLDVFSDNGSLDPTYTQISQGQIHAQPTLASGEHITFQVQGVGGIGTIEVFSVHRNSDNKCHVQVQGLFTYT
jgi:hypothetical protein